ncbi:MAG: glutamate racemase [Oscillospiraceae bacterium]|nr:glutamate racemase [Oscillospiraceae bacterium]
MDRNSPIVVFDSGVGGVSVLRSLVRELPCEQFVYFGDSANAPYGPRQTEEIRSLTLENLARLKAEWDFKAAVIACNTATSAAIGALRATYPDLPVLGIEPALKPAADRHPGGTVVVMATETTLREEKFATLTQQMERRCRVVSLPCPRLVEFIESGETDSSALEDYLREMLGPYLQGQAAAVVLGCTHFPFADRVLRRILDPATELLDGSEGTARNTRSQLAERSLLRESGEGGVQFLNSNPDPSLIERCRQLLQLEPLPNPIHSEQLKRRAVMDPRERFIAIFRQYIHRPGAEALLEFLTESDFFTAPASARYHSATAGGLCQHSLNVYDCLRAYLARPRVQQIYGLSGEDYGEESVAIVSLLHDLCKIGCYRPGFRNVKDERGVWQKVATYNFEDQLPFGHGEKSVWMVMKYMDLTDHEAFAIRYHMGFSGEEDARTVGQALAKFPLAFALNVADSEATYFLETTP